MNEYIVLATIHKMKWYLLIVLFILIPPTYADTINIGGGGTQTCKGDFNSTHPTEWHYHLFPVPVMIDSRMDGEKIKMFIYAIAIWNRIYKAFTELAFGASHSYPQKLFAYRIINSNYSDYAESPYIIWVSETSLLKATNARTEYLDKWYWVSHTIKGTHINMNSRVTNWHFEKNNPLNSNWNWPRNVDRNKRDFLTVAMHELGHSIGLRHTRDRENIMFPCAIRGKRVYPQYEDITKFFTNHDDDIRQSALPALMGAE